MNIYASPSGTQAFLHGNMYIFVNEVPFHLCSSKACCVYSKYYSFAVQGCKTNVGLRNILCSIQKEDKGWWKRILKSEEKPAPFLKVDWNKWCDEDEEPTNCKFPSILVGV